jgi:hypothetical protein
MRGNRNKNKGLVFGTISGSGGGRSSQMGQPKALRIQSNVATQFGRSLNQQKPTTVGGTGFSGRSGSVLRRR